MHDENPPLPVADVMRRRSPGGGTRPPRARPYLRLLWIIPGLAMLAAGLYAIYDVEDDGVVHTVQLTTKPGVVGQASEALRLVKPGTPDLYLKIKSGEQLERTSTYKDTPIGNGLKWPLKEPARMRQISEIEVWDENVFRDDFKDRVSLAGWSAEGQAFRIDLHGTPLQPPGWAYPLAAVGGVITLIALLRFVWDQVI
jgi:hypothetical protein